MYGNNPFRVNSALFISIPGFSLRSNPGLKFANAFGVIVTGFFAFRAWWFSHLVLALIHRDRRGLTSMPDVSPQIEKENRHEIDR
jgi:hypothetical protein